MGKKIFLVLAILAFLGIFAIVFNWMVDNDYISKREVCIAGLLSGYAIGFLVKDSFFKKKENKKKLGEKIEGTQDMTP